MAAPYNHQSPNDRPFHLAMKAGINPIRAAINKISNLDPLTIVAFPAS
jgi:hypothetical protein